MKQYLFYNVYMIIFIPITYPTNTMLVSINDDINSPTCWVDNPSNPAPVILPSDVSKSDFLTLNQRHFYRPNNINDVKDLIVCAFIHDQALEQNNNYQEHLDYVKRFATWYATIKHKNLELLSCQYTEPWSDNKQVKAGEQLQNILTQYYPNAETVLFGHSNGANISNYVSRITPAEKPIDLMIHLSCPRKHRDNYQPLHYKNLLYFFSDNDGAGTPAVSWYDYFTSHNKLPHGTHDFINIDDKITIGFNVMINGHEPHNIMDIILSLSEIIEQTLQQYPYNYTQSSSFHLNIDNTKNNNNLHIILRKKILNDLSSPSRPQIIDYLVHNNNVNNNIKPRSFLSLDNEDFEIDHSDHQKTQYRKDYDKDINESIPPATNTAQLQVNSSNSYFNTIATGTLITFFIALLYKLFFKKQPSPSENDNENDEEPSTETITAADIFNNFVLTTQPL